jgi:hypothetical protein
MHRYIFPANFGIEVKKEELPFGHDRAGKCRMISSGTNEFPHNSFIKSD